MKQQQAKQCYGKIIDYYKLVHNDSLAQQLKYPDYV